MSLLRNLLWVDCTAGAAAGVAMLALGGWLSGVYGLPRELLIFMGVVNLLYASYSFSLAMRGRRSRRAVNLLVLANLAWVPVCVGCAVLYREIATPFGMAHLLGEALFVGGLALLEWRHRELLVGAVEPALA